MNFFLNLGTRERVFIIGAGVAVLLALLFTMVIDPMLAYSARLDRQIITAQRELQELHTLRQDYQRQKSVLDRINAQLKRQKNFSIFSRLEELAKQTDTRNKILYIKPTVSSPSDAYEEESVEIKMEDVTLEQLIQYLFQIENSPQFMKIKRLYLKPHLDNRQLLSVIFRVSTFTPKEGTT
jgi:general secretion pathway protein M